MYLYKEKPYKSKKHPILEYIFFKKNPKKDTTQTVIPFTLEDIAEAYRECGIERPASISNTILDLTRKKRPIDSRLPESIYSLGYDLRSKPSETGEAGEFVFVGVGNTINSWVDWPENIEERSLSSEPIPKEIRSLIRNDEGALFSVMDYCDVLSQVLYNQHQVVCRVQHPMKWQPGEIDGCYFGKISEQKIIFPVEAKALTTGDDINLDRFRIAVDTFRKKLRDEGYYDINIIPIGVQMIENGINIAVFEKLGQAVENTELKLEKAIRVRFTPSILAWK
ncbi:MAG: hypothetical protein QXX19_05375 [Candidatus Caldarchaeum sp.]